MPKFDGLIKFRCPADWEDRIARIAAALRRDVPDLERVVFEDYIRSQEKELGLEIKDEPITPTHGPAPKVKPVNYWKTKRKTLTSNKHHSN